MAQIASANLCRLLRTKFSYFRAPGGDRLIDPESTTACYTCLLTQRPVGPVSLLQLCYSAPPRGPSSVGIPWPWPFLNAA